MAISDELLSPSQLKDWGIAEIPALKDLNRLKRFTDNIMVDAKGYETIQLLLQNPTIGNDDIMLDILDKVGKFNGDVLSYAVPTKTGVKRYKFGPEVATQLVCQVIDKIGDLELLDRAEDFTLPANPEIRQRFRSRKQFLGAQHNQRVEP